MNSSTSVLQSTVLSIDPAPPGQATKDPVPEQLVRTNVKKINSQPSLSKIESSVAATKPTKVKLDDIHGGVVGSDLWRDRKSVV